MLEKGRRVIRISKRTLGLVALIIAIALFAWYRMSSGQVRPMRFDDAGTTTSYGGQVDLKIANPENVGIAFPPEEVSKPYRNDQSISIGDTREFLKTSYSARVLTRNVQDVVTQAKNIVKGNDGRIDRMSSSEKNGYLTFVVPKSKFEAFRTEIEGLTHKKLFSETSSSQNLLSQKQSIEEQTNSIKAALESLRQQKESLLASHTQAVAAINKELQSIRSELSAVRKKIEETTDATMLESLRNQETTLVSRETTQKQKLTTENSKYMAADASLDNQIKSQNASLENVAKRDEKFSENIETVDGSIDVRWVSIWQMIEKFSPVPPEILIVVLVIIVWNVLARLSLVPKFVVI